MWFDDIDVGGRGIVQPARGPLGRSLRAARLDLLLSQETLGRHVGAPQSAISRLERGAPYWQLFCRCVAVMGGTPLVTIAAIPDRRTLRQRLFGDAGEAPDVGYGFDEDDGPADCDPQRPWFP